jgi:hypothetical protein
VDRLLLIDGHRHNALFTPVREVLVSPTRGDSTRARRLAEPQPRTALADLDATAAARCSAR